MQQILEEKLDRTIKEKEFKWDFQIKEEGSYGVEITAICRSWQQNFLKSFFKDDNLIVKIDDQEFSKKSIGWNGNNLKGLKKTNFFILKLNQGNHNLIFLASQIPKIEAIRIYKIEENEISYLPKDNYPIQEGNCRQWLTIILCNLGLNLLKIKASANQGKTFLFFKKDDSDLKLIINGEIQENQEPKSHKNWYWCGRTLKGKTKEFNQELIFSPGLHYLEFWADRSPEVEEIKLKIGKLKRVPTIDDPEWTGNFEDDSEEMILARMIFGEARGVSREAKTAVAWSAKNRIKDPRWGNTYHQVILQKKQYSAFNKSDPNLPYVKDPLLDESQKEAWYECYEIAGQVIKGELEDPTNGANHYYSDYIEPPAWTKSKEAEFKIKIDSLLFYDLKQKNSGSIKLSILIFLGIILIGGIIFGLSRFYEIKVLDKNQTQIITNKYFLIHPTWKEIAVIYFDQNGNYLNLKQLTHNGYRKSHLKVFSEQELLGYFQELHKPNKIFDYQDEEVRKKYYENYTALMIMNREEKEPFEIYRGDYHTSDWEWFSDHQVVVYKSCGSGCQFWVRINIETKKQEEQGTIFSQTQ